MVGWFAEMQKCKPSHCDKEDVTGKRLHISNALFFCFLSVSSNVWRSLLHQLQQEVELRKGCLCVYKPPGAWTMMQRGTDNNRGVSKGTIYKWRNCCNSECCSKSTVTIQQIQTRWKPKAQEKKWLHFNFSAQNRTFFNHYIHTWDVLPSSSTQLEVNYCQQSVSSIQPWIPVRSYRRRNVFLSCANKTDRSWKPSITLCSSYCRRSLAKGLTSPAGFQTSLGIWLIRLMVYGWTPRCAVSH